MSIGPVRLLVAGLVVALLVRAARGAWRNRAVTFAIWRGIGARHLLGAAGLLVVVLMVAGVLLAFVPPLRVGLGSLVGSDVNAVFTPLEEVASRAPPAAAAAPDWLFAAVATGFLGFLVLMLPWLAFIEEEVFRAGLERLPLRAELGAALWFGLAHLVMLIPLAAACAIAVAGFAYGRVYRTAYDRNVVASTPAVVQRAFRQTRRARRAAVAEDEARLRQAAGVYASTVWHATFNTVVVVLVWGVLMVSALGAG